jgi:hypothetical protein
MNQANISTAVTSRTSSLSLIADKILPLTDFQYFIILFIVLLVMYASKNYPDYSPLPFLVYCLGISDMVLYEADQGV